MRGFFMLTLFLPIIFFVYFYILFIFVCGNLFFRRLFFFILIGNIFADNLFFIFYNRIIFFAKNFYFVKIVLFADIFFFRGTVFCRNFLWIIFFSQINCSIYVFYDNLFYSPKLRRKLYCKNFFIQGFKIISFLLIVLFRRDLAYVAAFVFFLTV